MRESGKRGEPEITLNANESRFEVETGGSEPSAILTFKQGSGKINLIHTEVSAEQRRQGLGGTLVKAALDYARQNRLQVIPSCPFVRSFIDHHPEYLDLVPDDWNRPKRI